MKLYSYNRNPKKDAPAWLKMLWIVIFASWMLILASVLILGIVNRSSTSEALSFVAIMTAIMLLFIYLAMLLQYIDRSYIYIDGDIIHVVDYPFGIKRERLTSFSEIASARVAHLNLQYTHIEYIEFMNAESKRLFHVYYQPETVELFEIHTQITNNTSNGGF